MDFSWEPLGLLVSNFWEPNWLKRVLRTPRALDLVRPAYSILFGAVWYTFKNVVPLYTATISSSNPSDATTTLMK